MIHPLKLGLEDLLSAITEHRISAIHLGWLDIKKRYRRSKLGPIWLTISTGITAFGMGLIFGTIFGTPIRDFLPFLCCGLILWNFITTMVNESTTIFHDSRNEILNIKLPFIFFFLKQMVRNNIILGHNAMILIFIFTVFLIMPNFTLFLVLPGFFFFLINALWVSIFVAIFCARYPDLGQIIANVLQLSFFVTPIIWTPEMMLERGRAIFLDINPFYHLLSVVRAPILGDLPDAKSWVVLALTAIVGWLVTLYLLGRYHKKIVYWV